MIARPVKLYLTERSPVRIPVSQFDTAWQFVFTIIKDSVTWTIPSGATAVLNGLKPDGNVFAFAGTISGNTVTVDCDVQMTAVAGDTICELSILADGKTVGTANFTLAVEAAPKSPSDISSNSTLPAYAEMLEMFSGDIEDEVDSWLNAHSSQIGGLTNEAKQALLTLLAHVAYTDDQGQTYLDALEAALYPPADLVSISAVFNQGSATIYDTDTLDTLRQYLTVTALYSDSSTEVVTTYTLSGTLTVGTSTITVSYGGKTDTFTVTVTKSWDSVWTYTEGLPTVDEWVAGGSGTPTMTGTGLKLLNANYSKDVAITNGRIEAHFTIVDDRQTFSGIKAGLRIGDSTNCVYVIFMNWNSVPKIRLYTNSTAQNGLEIGTFEFGGEYTVQIDINGSVGAVTVNGVTLKDDINTTSMANAGTLLFTNSNNYGASIWQYVKYMSNE